MFRTTRIALLCLVFATSIAAAAEEEPVTLDAMRHPGLLLKTSQPGLYVNAPIVRTEISLQVRGIIVRGVVTQRFENTTGHCVEAVYVFPLADNATVDAMRMKIGARTIDGQIKERQAAAREYEVAKSEGRRASLLEQHRPNVFTVSVASLPAGETAEIEIEYQQIVTYDDGRFSLRIPLAIGPRYTPPTSNPLPPMRFTTASKKRTPVSLKVDLDSGIALDVVKSDTHALQSTPLARTRVLVEPREVQIAGDRDFELVWTPRLGTKQSGVTFAETIGDDRYVLLMLFPPDVTLAPQAIVPREAIFIIDTSGSMGGPSIEQAKKALLTALRRLRSSDRFNVIEFNSTAQKLFDESRLADRDAVAQALNWVGSLESTGGTEMLSALQLALDGGSVPHGTVRQVVFITDGQVGNEAEVFGYIRKNLGDSSVFTIGIGNAPNTYFMRTAARFGRGTFTHIADLEQVEERMTALFRKLESPVATNMTSVWTGGEQWPRQFPDLYAGEPLVVTVRNPEYFEGSRQRHIEATGIAKLWARQKIDALRDSVFTGADAESVRKEIVATGLAHHLVTEHTSLVAVDTTPSGVDPRSCTSELVPIPLPAGWGGIEGALPGTATNARLWMLIGCALLLASLLVRRIGS